MKHFDASPPFRGEGTHAQCEWDRSLLLAVSYVRPSLALAVARFRHDTQLDRVGVKLRAHCSLLR